MSAMGTSTPAALLINRDGKLIKCGMSLNSVLAEVNRGNNCTMLAIIVRVGERRVGLCVHVQ